MRRTAAALLVVCAGLLIVGVTAEGDSHAETIEPVADHDEATEPVDGEAGHGEAAENAASDASHDEATEGAPSDAGHDESAERERVLGVNAESPGAVVLAVALSIALAVGLWIRTCSKPRIKSAGR